MAKLYTQRITSCIHCPAGYLDSNQTQFLCRKSRTGRRFICYNDEMWDPDTDEPRAIPDWCPLPEEPSSWETSPDRMGS